MTRSQIYYYIEIRWQLNMVRHAALVCLQGHEVWIGVKSHKVMSKVKVKNDVYYLRKLFYMLISCVQIVKREMVLKLVTRKEF